jgi:site-specific DNA recombinase
MSEYIYKPPASLPPGAMVIAYLRDSGGPNQEQSIGQQQRSITGYCEEYSLILVKIYADTASGRKTTNRRQFLQMISDVVTAPEDMRPAGLLIWEYSRFSRDVADFNYHLFGLMREGLAIHSLTEEIPEGIAGQILLSVKAYTNADFSIQLGKRIKRAIADTVKAGYSNGGQPPKGYLAVRDNIGIRRNGSERTGIKWIIDSELGPLVVRAWELRAQGKSYAEITKATNEKLYSSKNSWASHFENKSYLGIGKAGELEVPNHHEPLITQELWDGVQKVRESMPSFGKRGIPFHPRRILHPSLLSGLAVCIHCGAAMILHTAKNYKCYVCGNRDRKRGFTNCPNAQSVNTRKADKAVLDAVIKKILSPSYAEALWEETQKNLLNTNTIDQEINDVKKNLTDIERVLARLMKLAEGTGDLDEITKRLRELKLDKSELTLRLKVLNAERELDAFQLTPEAFALVVDTWRKKIEEANDSRDVLKTKNLLSQFVSKIELGAHTVTIHYNFPLGVPAEKSNGLSTHAAVRRVTRKLSTPLE